MTPLPPPSPRLCPRHPPPWFSTSSSWRWSTWSLSPPQTSDYGNSEPSTAITVGKTKKKKKKASNSSFPVSFSSSAPDTDFSTHLSTTHLGSHHHPHSWPTHHETHPRARTNTSNGGMIAGVILTLLVLTGIAIAVFFYWRMKRGKAGAIRLGDGVRSPARAPGPRTRISRC